MEDGQWLSKQQRQPADVYGAHKILVAVMENHLQCRRFYNVVVLEVCLPFQHLTLHM